VDNYVRAMHGRRRQVVPFACVALLGLALANGGRTQASIELYAAAGLTFLLIALGAQGSWRPRGGLWPVLAGLAYLLAVALMRDGAFNRAGAGPLVLLPVFWMALHGSRAQLTAVLAGVAAVFFVPVVALGYPSAGARAGLLLVVISAVIGPTIQRLVADLRARELEREGLLQRLDGLAHTDPLTGLANRRAWEDALGAALHDAGMTGTPLAVALLDLDRFKVLNDTQGHGAGDRLLRELAAGWSAAVRGRDVLARLGGDEFGLLLPDCSEEGARVLVERLRAEMPGEHTCSAGVAAWRPGETADALLARADAGLYAAKAAGRDRVAVQP
jgi:diguanylate cyclase (GGDEF)-like protein